MGKAPHQCHFDGCEAQATDTVHLHVRCPRPGLPSIEIGTASTIEVCDKHRTQAVDYLSSSQNREIIKTTLMDNGYPEPDFLQSRIEFKPIVSPAIQVIPPCTREGCANPGRWRIKHKFAEHGRKGCRVEALTNFFVCEKHKRDTTAAHTLTDEAWGEIKPWLNQSGVLLPDRERSTIEFVPVMPAFKVI